MPFSHAGVWEGPIEIEINGAPVSPTNPLPISGTVTATVDESTLATSAKQPGFGTAGSPSANVVSTQGIAGGTPYAVSQPGLTALATVCVPIPAAVCTITANTKAAASVVTTAIPHGLTSGETVTIAGSNSTVTIDGDRVVTVLSATTYSVPVDTSGGASAGTAGTSTYKGTGTGHVKRVDAADAHVSLRLVASPSNTTNVHIGASTAMTAFDGTTHAATDGEPLGPGQAFAADIGIASPMYAVSTAAAWVYYTGFIPTVTA